VNLYAESKGQRSFVDGLFEEHFERSAAVGITFELSEKLRYSLLYCKYRLSTKRRAMKPDLYLYS
jgi:hypothetical protein